MKILLTTQRPFRVMYLGRYRWMAALALIFLIRLPLSAQFYSALSGDATIYNAPTQAVYTVQNVSHTGYDYYAGGAGCGIQVYVWDGDDGGFGWNVEGHTNIIRFDDMSMEAAGLIDPDVIVGKVGDDTYAHIVGIVPRTVSGKTIYTLYYCALKLINCDFELVEDICFTPNSGNYNDEGNYPLASSDANGVPILSQSAIDMLTDGAFIARNVSSPNIDANSDGDIIIVWTETEWVKTSITLGDPYGASAGNPINILNKKGNVLYAEAQLGAACPTKCISHYANDNGDGSGSGNGWFGVPIAIQADENAAPNLFFSYSDVSISERPGSDPAVVSFAYVENRSGFFGAASAPNLVTVQNYFGNCYNFETPNNGVEDLTLSRVRDYVDMNVGIPRIAAPTIVNRGDEYQFTVVSGQPVGGCGAAGYFVDSRITMVGRRAFTGSSEAADYILTASVLNRKIDDGAGNTNPFNLDYIHKEPVVTYLIDNGYNSFDYQTSDHGIIVSWSCFSPVSGWDVIAKAYNDDGNPSRDETMVTDAWSYNIIPFYTGGHDLVPSVAARHGLSNNMGYFWVNSGAEEQEVHTLLPGIGGGSNIPGQIGIGGHDCMNGDNECFLESRPGQRIGNPTGISPNPVKAGGILNIASEDQVTAIELFSVSGQKIKGLPTLEINGNGAAVTLPKGLSQGLYTVKAITVNGIRNYQIVVQ